MLEKNYTLPIFFGIFLGLIFLGVHISTLAVNISLGKQEISPISIDSAYGEGIVIKLLDRDFHLVIPAKINQNITGARGSLNKLYEGVQSAQGEIGRCFKQIKENYFLHYSVLDEKINSLFEDLKQVEYTF